MLLAVAPAAFLLKYILVRRKYKQEPTRLLAITFLLGAAAILPATILELLFQSFNPLVIAFLLTAVVEEIMKFAAVRAKAYDSPRFTEVMDGIVYGVTASLGFATVENIFYVLGFGAISTAIVRAFLSVPSHAAYGGIMGYYLGLGKTHGLRHEKRRERELIVVGVGIAIALHGVFDAIAFSISGIIGFIGLLAIALLSWLILIRLIRTAISLVPMKGPGSATFYRFCTRCGARREEAAAFCVYCGQPITSERK